MLHTHYWRKPLKSNHRMDNAVQSVIYNAMPRDELATMPAITRAVGQYMLKNPDDSRLLCPAGRLDLFAKAIENTVGDLVRSGAVLEIHGAKLERWISQ